MESLMVGDINYASRSDLHFWIIRLREWSWFMLLYITPQVPLFSPKLEIK
jgi:hypothetical protein